VSYIASIKLLILRITEKYYITACEQQASVAVLDQGFDITGGLCHGEGKNKCFEKSLLMKC